MEAPKKMGGLHTKEHPIKMDDLEIPSFLEPQFAIAVCPHQWTYITWYPPETSLSQVGSQLNSSYNVGPPR